MKSTNVTPPPEVVITVRLTKGEVDAIVKQFVENQIYIKKADTLMQFLEGFCSAARSEYPTHTPD